MWIRPWLSVDRYPLHPVRPALELHPPPRIVAADRERDLVVAAQIGDVGRHHVDRPALAGGVALVHVEQIAGEQVRFLAPFGTANLDDYGLAVVGVTWEKQQFDLGVEAGQVRLGIVDLTAERVALVNRRLGEQLLRSVTVRLTGPVGAITLDHGREFLIALRGGAEAALIAHHIGITELILDRMELVLEPGKSIDHGWEGYVGLDQISRDDLRRRPEELGQRTGHGVTIAARHGDDEPRIVESEIAPRIGRVRDQVEIDAGRTHDGQRLAIEPDSRGHARNRILDVFAGEGRFGDGEVLRSDRFRFREQPGPEQPLCAEPIERMRGSTQAAVFGDGVRRPAPAPAPLGSSRGAA